MKKSVSGQVMKFSPKLATIFFDDFFTYNNSCPPFRAPCMADFLMEFRRGHCTDAPFPLHREKMVTGMDLDMDMGIAMVMGMDLDTSMGIAMVMPMDIHQERVNH